MHFFHPIQQSAQQIYHSALPLSPTSSQLQKLYLQSVIDNQLFHVTTYSGAPDIWGSLLRTIDVRPRQLTCIATSTQRIITACEDLVNIYDAITFVLQQSLHAPEAVMKIQASPDGTVLFFSHSISMTMWDVQTGGLVYTFTASSKISHIAVSTTHIACGLSDGFVAFWNIQTKEGKGFGTGQEVVTICWLSPQKLAVATQSGLHIHDITFGETLGKFPIPGHMWGMVYLESKDEFLVGSLQQGSGVGQEKSYFIRCKQSELEPHNPGVLHQKFDKLKQSSACSRKLLSPTLVDGDQVACITPPNGVKLFSTRFGGWIDSPPSPLLGATISLAVSLNRNIVVQTKDSIQMFSVDVLESSGPLNNTYVSQVYPLGGKHIIYVLQRTGYLTLLELETLQEICGHDDALLRSSLADRPPPVHGSFIRGLVVEFGIQGIIQTWESGTPLPEWAEAAGENAPLGGLSPECTRIATVYGSPRRGLRIKNARDGATLANLLLADDDLGAGEVYDLAFDSETRFYLKIDGPGWHVQIPYDIVTSPSGGYSHTITKGEPMCLPEPREKPPYTLDENCEWVLDANSTKICWISPGNARRGNGGHFWAGLSLIMVGDDGVLRKLTFKKPGC